MLKSTKKFWPQGLQQHNWHILMSLCCFFANSLQSFSCLSCDLPSPETSYIWRDIFVSKDGLFEPPYYYSSVAVQWLCWSSGLDRCSGLLFGWTHAYISVFVCVWGLLIFQHCPTPDACTTQQCLSLHVYPCIYLTVLLKCILTPSMRREPEGWGGGVYSQTTAQDISLYVFFSTSATVIWALIYVLLWQRLTSFLTGSLCTCTLGETTKAWVYRADEHHEG